MAGSASETFDQAAVSGTATFVGDEHAALAVLINRVANQIATRTRRGAGNYAVVSPTSLTILQSATTSARSQDQLKVHLKHQQILNSLEL